VIHCLAGVVRESGNIVKCFDEVCGDFVISDELRKVMAIHSWAPAIHQYVLKVTVGLLVQSNIFSTPSHELISGSYVTWVSIKL